MDADLRELFEKYGVLAGLVVSLLMFVAASLLWASGNEPIGGLLGVLAMVWPLSVLAVALDGLGHEETDEDESDWPRRD